MVSSYKYLNTTIIACHQEIKERKFIKLLLLFFMVNCEDGLMTVIESSRVGVSSREGQINKSAPCRFLSPAVKAISLYNLKAYNSKYDIHCQTIN